MVHTCTYLYVLVCTSLYLYILLPVCTCTYQYGLVCTGIYQYILVYHGMYRYIPACTGMYWYIGRVPLLPLFLAGNSTPTIPHKFSKHKVSGFPMGCADLAASDGRRGCNVYEVNTWLWNFGCGKPRLGGRTVEETAMRKKTVRTDQAKRSAETCRRWREDGA